MKNRALHGYLLEAQKDALTKYALKMTMVIVDYYIDDGYDAPGSDIPSARDLCACSTMLSRIK
jgi:hypothetical protein